jgi:hypothetical protein
VCRALIALQHVSSIPGYFEYVCTMVGMLISRGRVLYDKKTCEVDALHDIIKLMTFENTNLNNILQSQFYQIGQQEK